MKISIFINQFINQPLKDHCGNIASELPSIRGYKTDIMATTIPSGQIELTLAPATLTASFEWREDPSTGDYPEVMTNPDPPVIQDDQPWRIRLMNMTQTGAVFGALTGSWHFRVYFEKIGPGPEPAPLAHIFALNSNTPYVYPVQTINVAAGYLTPGIYEMYAEIELVDAAGLVPMTGFNKLGDIKIVNA